METFGAIQIQEPEQFSFIRLPLEKPKAGEVLVSVKAVTTCPQWDLHIYYGKPMFASQLAVPFPYTPGQPGHEMTGVVAAVGEGCTLKPGQTVCAWKDPGQKKLGCYAEYVMMNEEHLLVVPEHLPLQQVVSLELAMCVSSSVMKLRDLVGIKGKTCMVNGLGPAGLIALQLLLAEGAASVIGIDPNEQRREIAKKLGAYRVYESGDASIPLRRNRQEACALTIDCVGYPDAVRFAMDRTVEAIALFAVQRDDYIYHHPGLVVIGYPGHHKEAAEYALGLIIEQKLDLSVLISRTLSFKHYGEGVELLKNQSALKICFVLDADSFQSEGGKANE